MSFEYYEYVLVYTDGLLIASHDPAKVMSSIGKPKQYLGNQVSEFRFPDSPAETKRAVLEFCFPESPAETKWAMSSEKYVKEAVCNVKSWLDEASG